MSDEFGTYEMREVRRVINLSVKFTGMDKHNDGVREAVGKLRNFMMVYITVVAGYRIVSSLLRIIATSGTSASKDIPAIVQSVLTSYIAESSIQTLNEVS